MAPSQRSAYGCLGLEQLMAGYDELKEEWMISTCRAGVLSQLNQHRPSGGWDITGCVLMALGSLSFTNDECNPQQRRRRRLIHLAIFLDLADYLKINGCSSTSPPTLSLYAQEPCFNSVDEEFLRLLGITTLHEPEAEKKITSSFFVFAPCYGFDHEIMGRERELRPSLYIGIPYDMVLSNAESASSDFWKGSADQKTCYKTLERRLRREVAHEYDCVRMCETGCHYAHTGPDNAQLNDFEMYCRK